MSNTTRAQAVIDNLAGRVIAPATALTFINAVVDEKNLEPDPDNPQSTEIRCGLFIQWAVRVLKTIKADAVAKAKYLEAEQVRLDALISAGADLE